MYIWGMDSLLELLDILPYFHWRGDEGDNFGKELSDIWEEDMKRGEKEMKEEAEKDYLKK
ncbi:hypothetical protein AGMMS49938_04890 [Fibrobacterales bacterium]|nr:hypothetical protein AGMMS49938_04890 [Fibrobacterales bacterium]